MIKKLFDGHIYHQHLPYSKEETAKEWKKKHDSSELLVARIEQGEFQNKPVFWIWLRYLPPGGKYNDFCSNLRGLKKALDEYQEYSDLLKKTLEHSNVVILSDGRKWRNVSREYPYDISDLKSGKREARKDVKDYLTRNLTFASDEQLRNEEWMHEYNRAVKRFPKLLRDLS